MKLHNNSHDLFNEIRSGQRIFVHGQAATPHRLIEGLLSHSARLENVELVHLHTMGDIPYADSKYSKSFRIANLFVGPNLRGRLDYDRIDYIPLFLSEIPALFRSRRRPLDAALIHVSPPDQHGYCTLGTSVDVALAAIESAPLIIAQINKKMPRVHGDGVIHVSQIHHAIEVDDDLPVCARTQLTKEELAIGRFAAGIIEDGATLQMGIGAVPDAILQSLKDHRHLGIHSEMWSDGALDLIKSGAVDNSQKEIHPGRTVSGFVFGSQAVYDFIHDNPSVIQLDIAEVNSPSVIAQNPKVAAINSALEVDLTGQVCADSIGSKIISGVGGQMDFIRGASLSKGGKPIIALTSRTAKGVSKIVPVLKQGAGVVTTRSHVHYIITEYGVADLYGKSLGERARALIQIAHPEDRESLESKWFELSKSV